MTPAPTATPSLLVVEDDLVLAKDMQRRLQFLGYRVPAVVHSGEAAIAWVGQNRADLILMDVVLSGRLDGIEAAAEIKGRVDVPIIFLTGNVDQVTRERAASTDPSCYLLKPVGDRELQAVVNMALAHHAAQVRARANERRLGTTLTSIAEGVIATDEQGQINLMNPVAMALTGWMHSEAMGKSLSEVVRVRDDASGAILDLAAALRQPPHRLLGHACWVIDTGGHTTPVDLSAAPLEDAFGATLGTVVTFRNTTERRKAEEALRAAKDDLERRVQERTAELALANRGLQQEIADRRQAEAHVREQAELLDKAQDAIIVRDLQHRVLYWNKSAERVYGWTAAEAIGQNALTLMHGKETAETQQAFACVLEKGEWTGELPQRRKDGRDLVVESRSTLVRGSDGQPTSVLAVNTDITERKKLEAKYLRTQRLESVGALAGGIAHDLNNVFTPILMSAEFLRDLVKDPTAKEMVQFLQISAERGSAMVRQVLAFARGAEGERAVLQIKHLVRELEKLIKDTFPRSIQLRCRMPAGLNCVIGDATQLYQVLMNLSVNARDAMPNGGKLTIEAANAVLTEDALRLHPEVKPGPFVVLTISDTGGGMPPEVLDKLFEPFFTTKQGGNGTGLGLATVLGIVKGHGGYVDVDSEVGQGTRICVYLPATAELPDKAGAPAEPAPRGHGQRILFVDDEAAVRDVGKASLEQNGYRVVTAADGTEALALYARQPNEFDLVVMDVMMPYLDGLGTTRALRRLNPLLKVILISGLPDNERRPEVRDDPRLAFVLKPFATDQLLGEMHRVLALDE